MHRFIASLSRSLPALALLVLPVRAAISSPEGEGPADPRFARISAILEERRVALHITGLSFALVENDRVVYLKALGERVGD